MADVDIILTSTSTDYDITITSGAPGLQGPPGTSGNVTFTTTLEPTTANEGDTWYHTTNGTLSTYVSGVWTRLTVDGQNF